MGKTLLRLGTNEGIAGEFTLTTEKTVMGLTPYRDSYSYSGGDRVSELYVTAITREGIKLPLEQETDDKSGDQFVPDHTETAPTIGEQLAAMTDRDIVGIELTRKEYCDWEDNAQWKNFTEYFPVEQPDWKKLRRRLEDRLRKMDDIPKLYKIAIELNVNVY